MRSRRSLRIQLLPQCPSCCPTLSRMDMTLSTQGVPRDRGLPDTVRKWRLSPKCHSSGGTWLHPHPWEQLENGALCLGEIPLSLEIKQPFFFWKRIVSWAFVSWVCLTLCKCPTRYTQHSQNRVAWTTSPQHLWNFKSLRWGEQPRGLTLHIE